MSDITRVLSKIKSGDQRASDELLPLVYTELRRLASAKMAKERPDHTLQATGLVHEAFLRLVSQPETQHWESRAHFFSAAAEAMRRILVESARRKNGVNRGGKMNRVGLESVFSFSDEKSSEILCVHEALAGLSEELPVAAELVKLRYFGGMTQQEAAGVLRVSRSTADRYWAFAKAALSSAIRGED